MELTEKLIDKLQINIQKIKPIPLTYENLVDIESGTISYLTSLGFKKINFYVQCKKWDDNNFVLSIEHYKNQRVKKIKRLI
jgi:hypothetical protein